MKTSARHPQDEAATPAGKTLLERLGPGLITSASDVNWVVAAPIMIVEMVMVGNAKVMGRFTLVSGWLRSLGWAAAAGMFVSFKH